MKLHGWMIVFFLSFSFILSLIFFRDVHDVEFLFIGDQFFRFSYQETFLNSFFIRKIEDLGLLNGWQFIIQFWDTAFYLVVYSLGIPFTLAEKILFFSVLSVTLCSSYFGFLKLDRLYNNQYNPLSILVITLWYSFSPYVVILWHGGVYNLGSAMTYALGPFVVYFFHKVLFTETGTKEKLIAALLLTLASFTFWLVAPLVFFLMVYVICYLCFFPNHWLKVLKNTVNIMLFYLPMVSFVAYAILFEYFNNVGDINAEFTPTFGNQTGGIWYQLLMLSSWGIYNVWTPRSLYSFHEHYFSTEYVRSTIALYVIIIIGCIIYGIYAVRNNFKKWRAIFSKGFVKVFSTIFPHAAVNTKPHIVISILIALGLAIFLAKASQPPFGEIFLFLYEKIPFFSVFRTPDIRFGFTIVLCLSLLLVLLYKYYNRYLFIALILSILILQSSVFFDGRAVRGENKGTEYYDRVLSYPAAYEEVIAYFKEDKSFATYVLPIPAIEYGNYDLAGDHHFGQDILSKKIPKPFLYLSLSKGMATDSYKALNDVLITKQYSKLRHFPIQYILFRRDISCQNCTPLTESDVKDFAQGIVTNKYLSLYEMKDYSPLVTSSNSEFSMINPVKYKVKLNSLTRPQAIHLLLSYKKDWEIYLTKPSNHVCSQKKYYRAVMTDECIVPMRFFEGDELTYLVTEALFEDTHRKVYDYANEWIIDPALIRDKAGPDFYTVNPDGTINVELVVYYKPQTWFYLFFIVSLVSVLLTVLYILTKHDRQIR